MEIANKLHNYGVIPVIEIDPAEAAIPLGEALIAGGLPVAEVTFRTSAAEYAIKLMAKHHPQILLGGVHRWCRYCRCERFLRVHLEYECRDESE